MKIENGIGCYVEARCCAVCDWFEKPLVTFQREVCPACGSPIEITVGRYEYKITKRIFAPDKTEFTGFIRGQAD